MQLPQGSCHGKSGTYVLAAGSAALVGLRKTL